MTKAEKIARIVSFLEAQNDPRLLDMIIALIDAYPQERSDTTSAEPYNQGLHEAEVTYQQSDSSSTAEMQKPAWWNEISEAERAAIEEGLAQADRGELISSEQVRKEIKEKFGF